MRYLTGYSELAAPGSDLMIHHAGLLEMQSGLQISKSAARRDFNKATVHLEAQHDRSLVNARHELVVAKGVWEQGLAGQNQAHTTVTKPSLDPAGDRAAAATTASRVSGLLSGGIVNAASFGSRGDNSLTADEPNGPNPRNVNEGDPNSNGNENIPLPVDEEPTPVEPPVPWTIVSDGLAAISSLLLSPVTAGVTAVSTASMMLDDKPEAPEQVLDLGDFPAMPQDTSDAAILNEYLTAFRMKYGRDGEVYLKAYLDSGGKFSIHYFMTGGHWYTLFLTGGKSDMDCTVIGSETFIQLNNDLDPDEAADEIMKHLLDASGELNGMRHRLAPDVMNDEDWKRMMDAQERMMKAMAEIAADGGMMGLNLSIGLATGPFGAAGTIVSLGLDLGVITPYEVSQAYKKFGLKAAGLQLGLAVIVGLLEVRGLTNDPHIDADELLPDGAFRTRDGLVSVGAQANPRLLDIPDEKLLEIARELGFDDIASLRRWLSTATIGQKKDLALAWYRRQGLALIDSYRTARNALPGSEKGTVAFIEANGMRYWGHNSKLVSEVVGLKGGPVKLELGMDLKSQAAYREFFGKHPLFKNLPELRRNTLQKAFSHAEVQAFLRMIEDAKKNHGGKVPKSIIIVLDRGTCPECLQVLRALKEYFGLERIQLLWRTFPHQPHLLGGETL